MPLISDPIDLLLDATNDLVFVNGRLQWSTGIQAVLQSCRITLQMFQGEWFLNLDAGIPYWQSILGQKPAIAIKAARIAFRAALEKVDGVDEVLSVDVKLTASRQMSVTFSVRCAFGDTTPESIVLGSATSVGGA